MLYVRNNEHAYHKNMLAHLCVLSHGHTRPYDVVRLPAMGKFGGIGDHSATLNDVSEIGRPRMTSW